MGIVETAAPGQAFVVTLCMVYIGMEYDLNCDSCGYEETAVEEERADVLAKRHEDAYADHFVLIETVK